MSGTPTFVHGFLQTSARLYPKQTALVCGDQRPTFTELDEHNKEAEISRAMAGDHLFDGFIGDRDSRQAKQVIADILDRLNQGEDLGSEAVGALLAPIMAD